MAEEFQYVKLPDGSYGKFRPDATDAMIRSQILKDFPKAFAKPSESQQAATMVPATTQQARDTVAKPITGKPAFPPSKPSVTPGESLGDAGMDPANKFTDPAELIRQVNEMNKEPERKPGLLRNMFVEEPKAILKGAFAPPDSVAGYTPPDLQPQANAMEEMRQGHAGEAVRSAIAGIPVVGPIISARTQQGEKDPWGASGAAIDDVLALALPFALGAKGEGTLEKVTARQGAGMLADTIADESLSPAQAGSKLQQGFDSYARGAGLEKAEVVNRIASEAPNTTIKFRNTIKVLKTEVENLQELKKRNPVLFGQGEGLDKTLKILEQELSAVNTEGSAAGNPKHSSNIAKADQLRSQYFNYRQQLDPSMAKRIVGSLNEALTKDVLVDVGETHPELAHQYVNASNRYRSIQDVGRAETLRRVFGNKRVAPDKVVAIMSEAPEESLRAIRALSEGDPQDIQNLRRSIFEYGANKGTLRKLQPAAIREVFGPQAEAVTQFIEATNPLKAPSNPILAKIPGRFGTGVRFVVNATTDAPGIYITGEEMSKILKSANMTRVMTQAAQMPVSSGPASMMHKMVVSALMAAGVQPDSQGAER